jgi:hypothetical protein
VRDLVLKKLLDYLLNLLIYLQLQHIIDLLEKSEYDFEGKMMAISCHILPYPEMKLFEGRLF